MDDLLMAVEALVLDLAYEVLPRAKEDDDLVEGGTVAHELGILEPGTDEALLAVDVELRIQLGYLGGLDGAEAGDLGAPWVGLAVAVDQVLVPAYRILYDMI